MDGRAARTPHFFVSYTDADRAWAEWIAWQLEADGYDVVIQAWDFTAGRDWVHEMQVATRAAERVVAVLSPDYLDSEHGEAEWGVFYARDPRGEDGLLLPVRVRPVEAPGLLMTRSYVDLVDRKATSARTALIAAARMARGKPPDEPEYPGDLETPSSDAPPVFPGAGTERPADLDQSIRVDDRGALRALLAEAAFTMRGLGFSADDVHAFDVSVKELIGNVAAHVRPDDTVQLELMHIDPRRYQYHEGLQIGVLDSGPGFDFEAALRDTERKLLEDGEEHGLLHAYRLGSMLVQVSRQPHKMGWGRERSPEVQPVVFDHDDVVPFVFSYEKEAILIWRETHTFFQFEQYLERSERFMDLVFDQLLRPARPYVGIEILGSGWTGVLKFQLVLDQLLEFATRTPNFDKQLIVFADTGPATQRWLRRSASDFGVRVFEDERAVRDFLGSLPRPPVRSEGAR